MKVLNINRYFYPESIGGAAVVAEKLAWGLVQAGHDVTNVFLSSAPPISDFRVLDTPFGRSIGIRNISSSPAHQFYNPAATSALKEIVDIVDPDRIFIHAAQHMGVHELLADPIIRSKACIIAHDFYWTCLQGFRRLPDGSNCGLIPGPNACRQCAWYPGLTDNIYASSRSILASCRAVVFPSQYLHSEYVHLLGRPAAENFTVQANPDMAETVFPDTSVLPEPAGIAERATGKTVLGFVGGPGETKGWSLVRAFMDCAAEAADCKDGIHVVLFDSGRSVGAPWYPHMNKRGVTVADPFHWTFASHALEQIDVMLMPSRVRESFGLAAREALSLGKSSIIRPSGALTELKDYRGVIVVEDSDDVSSLMKKLSSCHVDHHRPWTGTSTADYADRMISL